MENDLSDQLWARLIAFQTETFQRRASGLRYLAHYTDFAALKAIVETEEVWFSSASTMNDLDEIVRGKELLQELSSEGQPLNGLVGQIRDLNSSIWEDANKAFSAHLSLDLFHTYLSCWSECDLTGKSHDDLTMWRGYARNGDGVSIVVDALKLGLNETFQSNIVVCPIFYETREEFAKRAATYLGSFRAGLVEFQDLAEQYADLIVDAFGELCFYLAVTHKHPGFRAEKEWRFAWRKHRDGGLAKHLRPVMANGSLVEKFCFPIRTDSLVSPHELDVRGLISSIMIGPCDHGYLKAEAAISLLRSKGFSNAEKLVNISSIPFRSTR